jgi:hypothetical protein
MRNAFEPEIEIIASQFPSVNQAANFKEKKFPSSLQPNRSTSDISLRCFSNNQPVV